MTKIQAKENQKKFKRENIRKENKKEVIMAYYCKKCQLWHYQGSAIYYAHKSYAHQGIRPRRIVKRRKKSFWNRF